MRTPKPSLNPQVAKILPPTRKSACPMCDPSIVSGSLSASRRKSLSVISAGRPFVLGEGESFPVLGRAFEGQPIAVGIGHCEKPRVVGDEGLVFDGDAALGDLAVDVERIAADEVWHGAD